LDKDKQLKVERLPDDGNGGNGGEEPEPTPPPPFQPHNYVVRLNGFSITTTRSRYTDTDYVCFAVQVGDHEPQFRFAKIGDIDEGHYDLNWDLGPFYIDDANTKLKFNYQIINTSAEGHWGIEVIRSALIDGARKMLAEFATVQLYPAVVSGIRASDDTPQSSQENSWDISWLFLLIYFGVKFLADLLASIAPDCDGAVAIKQHRFRGQTLWDMTLMGPAGGARSTLAMIRLGDVGQIPNIM